MSELIATSSGEIRARNKLLGLWWYGKFEVDKLIAEKESKLQNVSELLKETREWLIDSQKLHKRCADNAVKVIRHQKYRRCMAMHDYCLCELEFSFRDPCIERSTEGCVRWRKWANLWLELA